MAAGDARSTTASNNRLILDETGQSVWTATGAYVREKLRAKEELSEQQLDTAVSLGQALQDRDQLLRAGLDTTVVQQYIEEIC